MIEHLLAKARMRKVEDAAREAEWLRWWPSALVDMRKVRGL
jgi:hypothetical protein